MLWLSLLGAFALALTLRCLINGAVPTATPDEKRYSQYAAMWRPGRTYRDAIQAFLTKPGLEIPPTRFAFFALCAILTRRKVWTETFLCVTWVSTVAGAAAAPLVYAMTGDWVATLLVTSSPLSLMLGRRALQDTFAALTVLLALWAISLGNLWLLGAATVAALTTREALALYLPALLVSWGIGTGRWVEGGAATGLGTVAAVAAFYIVGGRDLARIFTKLRQPTAYVRQFQSGLAHRVLVDLILVAPTATIAGILACQWAPPWLVCFTGIAAATHACIDPKNIRFLLVVELALRVLCSYLPTPWNWAVLGTTVLTDFRLYFAVGGCKDPATHNLVVRMEMYHEG